MHPSKKEEGVFNGTSDFALGLEFISIFIYNPFKRVQDFHEKSGFAIL
jgi:hypothetical protein